MATIAHVDPSLEDPLRSRMETTAAAAAKIEQAGLDIKYTAEITTHAKRVQVLEANITKSYSMIMDDYCTPAMRSRIQEHPDFYTKIRDDPIVLLQTIMSSMHEAVRAQYPLVAPLEFIRMLLTCKQGTYPHEEALIDWSKRLKQNADLTDPYIGKSALDYYVEQTPEYKAAAYRPSTAEAAVFIEHPDIPLQWKESTDQKAIKIATWKSMLAFRLIQGSDQSKYGSLCKNLQAQYSLGNDQYPKTLETAVDVLNQHRYDPKYFESKKKDRERRNNNNNNNGDANSESMPQQQTSFAQTAARPNQNRNVTPQSVTTAICHCCGETGHISKYCPKINTIPRDDWHVKRWMAAYQEQQETAGSDEELTEPSVAPSTRTSSVAPSTNSRSGNRTANNQRARGTGWQGFQFTQFFNLYTDLSTLPSVQSHAQKLIGKSTPFKTSPPKVTNLRDAILLDSGSSIDGTFCNESLVTNVRPAARKIGMQTNAGTQLLDVQADVPGFGTVYFDKSHVTNIFGLSRMVDTADRVTFDSVTDGRFYP